MGQWKRLKTSGSGWIEAEREASSGWKALLEGAQIDAGAPCIFGSYVSIVGYTRLDRFNVANDSGYITNVCLYAYTAGNVKVGLFYLVSGTTYKCRSVSSLLALSVGENNKAVELPVHTDDLIGMYAPTSGGSKIRLNQVASMSWTIIQDVCVVGAEAEFNNSNYKNSMYGTGY